MSAAPSSADYSLRILWTLARWIEETKGKEVLDKVARDAGVRAGDFDGSTKWVAHQQFETFLDKARELAGDDEAFKQACAYRFAESYGAFRYMMWAVSQQRMAEAAAKLSTKVVSPAGHFEILKSEANAFDFRYRSDCPESRLMCLCRQVHWTVGPTMWGMPPIQLAEHGCIGRGDEYCEYHLRWFERSRAMPVVLGFLIGTLCAVALWVTANAHLAIAALPFSGGAFAYLLELRRTSSLNIKFAADLNRVLRELGESEAESRAEIFGLHQRQREWSRLMEQQVTERTTTLERVVDGLDEIQQTRATTIRGFSHDLRNPLFVIRGNTQFLRERITDGEEGEALDDMEHASKQIESMLSRLMDVATKKPGFVEFAPRLLSVAPLADMFRRRLKALVHGRDIKVSVFATREAPAEINIDPLVFDRVVDNILTNAAKYTERGSIVLELSGRPAETKDEPVKGFLTLKLSDTGEGIQPAEVERIFRPRPAEEPSRPNSYGIGLSSVVRLLAQIGGRIDVMTKPAVGTTFWVHLPVEPVTQQALAPGEDNLESMIMRVVTIRRVEGAA